MSNEVATIIDPFTPITPDEEAELRALVNALKMADGFKLIFVRCNQPDQRRRLIESIKHQLPELNFQHIELRERTDHLLDTMRAHLAERQTDAIFVSGLEHSLPSSAEAASSPLIANLNASRNTFRSAFNKPVVMWVAEYVLTAIIRGAPDFFSIRSGVYFFAASSDEAITLAQSLTGGAEWTIDSLSISEKQERIRAIENLLADYESMPIDQRNNMALARLHTRLASIFEGIGSYDASLAQAEKAFKIFQQLGDQEGMANSLNQIGMIHQRQGKYESALEKYEQSLRISEELGSKEGAAISIHQIGTIHQERDEYESALEKYEQSLKIEEELQNKEGVAYSLHQIGMIHQQQGEYESALEKYEQSLKMARDIGNRAGMAMSLHHIGLVYQVRGEYESALEKYEQSLRIKEEIGNQAGIAASRGQIGKVFTLVGRYSEAFEHLLFALITFAKMRSPNVQIVAEMIRDLRAKWGIENFDAAWQQATAENVPDWLTQSGDDSSEIDSSKSDQSDQ